MEGGVCGEWRVECAVSGGWSVCSEWRVECAVSGGWSVR